MDQASPSAVRSPVAQNSPSSGVISSTTPAPCMWTFTSHASADVAPPSEATRAAATSFNRRDILYIRLLLLRMVNPPASDPHEGAVRESRSCPYADNTWDVLSV